MALRAFWPPVKLILDQADEDAFQHDNAKDLQALGEGPGGDGDAPPHSPASDMPSLASRKSVRPSSLMAQSTASLNLPAPHPPTNADPADPTEQLPSSPLLDKSPSSVVLLMECPAAPEGKKTAFMRCFEASVAGSGGWGLACLRTVYHKYGLNHVSLLFVLGVYSGLGAGLFVWLEGPAQEARLGQRQSLLARRRLDFVRRASAQIFNDTAAFLLFVDEAQSKAIADILDRELRVYETQSRLGAGPAYDQHGLLWDFWSAPQHLSPSQADVEGTLRNAMLYCWTLITTIGYGHIFPMTDAGKIATMVYAIFGIPLMLLILNDLGKVLTKLMKFPWFLMKTWGRRLFQYCTRMSREQIRIAEKRDKQRLEVFDLPLPVAIGIVVGWIFLCSAVQLVWEEDWDYLVAFYFFFISLSTIGLGDIEPENPKYLLYTFGNIIVGLSLVSMCISLIQMKLESTYKAGEGGQKEARETHAPALDVALTPEDIAVLPFLIPDKRPKDPPPPDQPDPGALVEVEPLAESLRKAHSVPVAIAVSAGSTPSASRRQSLASSKSAPPAHSARKAFSSSQEESSEETRPPTPPPQPPKRTAKLRKAGAKTKPAIETELEEAKTAPERLSKSVSARMGEERRPARSSSSYSMQGTQTLTTPELESETMVEECEGWERRRPPLTPLPPIAHEPPEDEDEEESLPLLAYSRDSRPRSPRERRIAAEANVLKKELSQYDNVQLIKPSDLLAQLRSEARLSRPQPTSNGTARPRFTPV